MTENLTQAQVLETGFAIEHPGQMPDFFGFIFKPTGFSDLKLLRLEGLGKREIQALVPDLPPKPKNLSYGRALIIKDKELLVAGILIERRDMLLVNFYPERSRLSFISKEGRHPREVTNKPVDNDSLYSNPRLSIRDWMNEYISIFKTPNIVRSRIDYLVSVNSFVGRI